MRLRKYGEIQVKLEDGSVDIWRERDGTCDGFHWDGGAFVVRKGDETAAVYSMAHMVSAVIK